MLPRAFEIKGSKIVGQIENIVHVEQVKLQLTNPEGQHKC